jgi:hypothetical protein
MAYQMAARQPTPVQATKMAGKMLPLVVVSGRAVPLADAYHRGEEAGRLDPEPTFDSDPETPPGLPRKQGSALSLSTAASDGAPSPMASDRAESSAASDAGEPKTTVQLRHVPATFSRSMLVSLLDAQGFKALYDFVYLPMSFTTKESLGYAFINFLHAEDAARFRNLLDVPGPPGLQRERPDGSAPDTNTSWSVWQGLAENTRRYRNSPVMGKCVPDAFKPAMFAEGKRIPFPRPTKKVKEPRTRKDLIKRTAGADEPQA